MDLAIGSSVAVESFFVPHSPSSSPPPQAHRLSPLVASPHPPSMPGSPHNPVEMDLSNLDTLPPHAQPLAEDMHMGNSDLLPNGNGSHSISSNMQSSDTARLVEAEEMDTTPDEIHPDQQFDGLPQANLARPGIPEEEITSNSTQAPEPSGLWTTLPPPNGTTTTDQTNLTTSVSNSSSNEIIPHLPHQLHQESNGLEVTSINAMDTTESTSAEPGILTAPMAGVPEAAVISPPPETPTAPDAPPAEMTSGAVPPPPPPPGAEPRQEAATAAPGDYAYSDASSSSDEEEVPDRVEITEDLSVPDEEELKEIEAKGNERSAADHEYWEKRFFKELDDPEHVPSETGRISWQIDNFHGPWNKPNKETIMRSPPVRLGGLDWNIKFYPRGNQTDQLSIYIECSKPGPKSDKAKTTDGEAQPEAATLDAGESAIEVVSEQPPQTSLSSPPATISQDAAANTSTAETPLLPEIGAETTTPPVSDQSLAPDDEKDTSWGSAAQFGVVLYNPGEPRVQYHHGNYHRFCADSPDWGWTRFYGPHSSIHQRFRLQRQALLRNDTLAFTAYIRIVKDETGSLWDHPGSAEWDSIGKTGFRGLGSEGPGRAYLIAALSSWFLLAPFRDIIYKSPTFNPIKEPLVKPKPLIAALQRTLYQFESRKKSDKGPVSLIPILIAFEWYGIELSSKLDTVEFWEVLRRKLEDELRGTEMEGKLGEIFDGVLDRASGQPDSVLKTSTGTPLSAGRPPSLRLPVKSVKNVQQAFKRALDADNRYGNGIIKRLPQFMQVELERQEFDKSTRRWKKVTDKLDIDEEIDLGPWALESAVEAKYSIYGFIVHEKDLQSSSYYPVLRPGGPGTKWIMFSDTKEKNKVVCLTRKQAVESHQGTSGKRNDGIKSVAYVLMYVRNDVLGDVLKGVPSGGEPPIWISKSYASNSILLNVNFSFQLLQLGLETDFFSTTGEQVDTADPSQEVIQAQLSESEDTNEDLVDLYVYRSESFTGYQGHGIVDVYASHSEKCIPIHLSMASKSTVMQFKERLADIVGGIENPRQCQIWDVYEGTDSVHRPSRIVPESMSLKSVKTQWPLMRFWLNVLPISEVPPLPAIIDEPTIPNTPENPLPTTLDASSQLAPSEPAPPLPIPPQTLSNSLLEAITTIPDQIGVADNEIEQTNSALALDSSGDIQMTEPTQENDTNQAALSDPQGDAMDAEPSPPAFPVPSSPVVTQIPATTLPETQDSLTTLHEAVQGNSDPEAGLEVVAGGAHTPLSSDPSGNAMISNLGNDPGSQLPPQSGDVDVEMGGTQDEAPSVPPPAAESWPPPPPPPAEFNFTPITNSVPPALRSSGWDAAPTIPPPASQDIYFFIKRFNPHDQSLVGIRSYTCKLSERIETAVRSALVLPQSDSFTLWEEVKLGFAKRINMKHSFEREDVFHGLIIIIQESLSDEATREIEERGDFSNPADYLKYLLVKQNHPEVLDGQVIRSYFSDEFFSGHHMKGRAHGPGTFTYTNGDTYTGNFMSNRRHGKGVMISQNKDSYDGDWQDGLMHGEGKFTYHKTRNHYVGGFKNGRRHGKGVMHYEVADEEMQLCQICYEGEIDCLFYDCGHVCACLDCAKQLENCPVCRKTVINVVKMFRT
ncbi:MAG: hypothetical protein M1829_000429 [Trizodia sp. TS-e1964]|nr:MAG: hypothetical protein M1829_000429 [Trizodia sp. TS-e1964]